MHKQTNNQTIKQRNKYWTKLIKTLSNSGALIYDRYDI